MNHPRAAAPQTDPAPALLPRERERAGIPLTTCPRPTEGGTA